MASIINVENFKKHYGEFAAVKGVSFQVQEGSLFAFLGPNGAGKSTTIDTLCTLLTCQEGHITIAGYELGKQDAEIRKNIGVVFQQSLLDNRLSIRENLRMRGSLYGMPGKKLKANVERVAEIAGTTDFMHKRYSDLSGGQRRRADIARALINQPKILFLDEPMTGLDPKTRESIWDMIARMRHEEGMTVFLTTHYMEEAANADDVVIIKKGLIVEEGTPAYLKEKYTRDHLIAYGWDNQLASILDRNGYTERELRTADELWIRVSGMQNVLNLIDLIRNHISNFEVKMGTMDEMFINIVGDNN